MFVVQRSWSSATTMSSSPTLLPTLCIMARVAGSYFSSLSSLQSGFNNDTKEVLAQLDTTSCFLLQPWPGRQWMLWWTDEKITKPFVFEKIVNYVLCWLLKVINFISARMEGRMLRLFRHFKVKNNLYLMQHLMISTWRGDKFSQFPWSECKSDTN